MSLSIQRVKITAFETVLFAMLGTVMLCGDIFFEMLPNIHLVGVLTVVYTVVFRKKALIPIYVYVFLTWFINGLSIWVLPYFYVWTVLWGMVILLPKGMPLKLGSFVYPAICALHGLLFGVLCAPAQAILFGMNLYQTVAWVVAGLPWDALHGAGNLAGGLLIVPAVILLKKLLKSVKI